MDKEKTILTFDIGTTAIKTCLFNENLKLVEKRTDEYDLTSEDGFVELESEVYWNTMLNAVAEIRKTGVFILQQIVLCGAAVLLTYWLALYEGIPNVLILLLILIGFYSFFTNHTVMGRHLYAMGGNAKAADLSGVKTKRLLFLAFVNMGFLASLAGIVFAGRLNAATPKAGTGFEMDAIAACYIGGASSSGGVGTVAGAVIGALIMGVLNNGMSIIGIDTDWQSVIKGIVLLVAVVFDTCSKNKNQR